MNQPDKAFTNKDLKRLKEEYQKDPRDFPVWMGTLLSCLEAAEAVCQREWELQQHDKFKASTSSIQLSAWRKAAGK